MTVLACLAACLTGLAVWLARVSAVPDASARAAERLDRHVARRSRRRRPEGRLLAHLDRRLVRAQIMAGLDRRLREAGVPLSVAEALVITCAGTAVLGGIAAAIRGMGAAVVMVAVCPPAALWSLGSARDRRVRRLDLQLPAALDLLVGQLRAHRSVAEALTEVVHRTGEPLRGECTRMVDEVRFGASLPQALDALRRRIASRPLATVVTAILVADRTGGNLAEFLSRQSRAVRDQVAFHQEVRAVTAHARSTATILTFLPVGVAAGMYLVAPEFFAPMLAPGAGRTLLGAAALMELAGWLVIRLMIRRLA